jgi:hypothetical protein
VGYYGGRIGEVGKEWGLTSCHVGWLFVWLFECELEVRGKRTGLLRPAATAELMSLQLGFPEYWVAS